MVPAPRCIDFGLLTFVCDPAVRFCLSHPFPAPSPLTARNAIQIGAVLDPTEGMYGSWLLRFRKTGTGVTGPVSGYPAGDEAEASQIREVEMDLDDAGPPPPPQPMMMMGGPPMVAVTVVGIPPGQAPMPGMPIGIPGQPPPPMMGAPGTWRSDKPFFLLLLFALPAGLGQAA